MYIENLLHCFLSAYVVERSLPGHQLETHDSKAPQVHSHIVLHAF